MNKLGGGETRWEGWTMVSSQYKILGSPKAVVLNDNFLQIYARNSDDQLIVGYFNTNSDWFGWHNRGGKIR